MINISCRHLLAGLAVLALAACTGPGVESAPPSGPGTVSTAAAATASRVGALRFPNSEVTAQLLGYDKSSGMVRFQLVQRSSGGADNGHYQVDPRDPGTHRLPLAAQPTVLSALNLCSTSLTLDDHQNPTQRCTREQLIQALSRGGSILAKLHVDGTDHIDRVSEIYQP